MFISNNFLGDADTASLATTQKTTQKFGSMRLTKAPKVPVCPAPLMISA